MPSFQQATVRGSRDGRLSWGNWLLLTGGAWQHRTMSTQTGVELFTPEYFEHPHETLARLRADEPVHPAVMPNGMPVWVVTRYHDVRAALTDPRLLKDHQRIAEIAKAKL